VLVNWVFVYPADPGKESATRRFRSPSAHPYPDIMKRHAAVRRDAVVANQRVDTPPVENGGRGPNAFADEDARPHAFDHPCMQACSSALIAELNDVAFREPKPVRIRRIDQHFGSLFADATLGSL
jgi:hypothetical protein